MTKSLGTRVDLDEMELTKNSMLELLARQSY